MHYVPCDVIQPNFLTNSPAFIIYPELFSTKSNDLEMKLLFHWQNLITLLHKHAAVK